MNKENSESHKFQSGLDENVAVGRLVPDFVRREWAFNSRYRNFARTVIRSFLDYADTQGWRLQSYLTHEDYEAQVKVRKED